MSDKVDYFEIGSPDPQASQAFYGELFGWSIGEPSEQQYRMVNGQEGGLWDTSAMNGGTWAIFYVHVDDVRATVEQAQRLGAEVVVPVVSTEAIEFAHLKDPHGNRFGVWRPRS